MDPNQTQPVVPVPPSAAPLPAANPSVAATPVPPSPAVATPMTPSAMPVPPQPPQEVLSQAPSVPQTPPPAVPVETSPSLPEVPPMSATPVIDTPPVSDMPPAAPVSPATPVGQGNKEAEPLTMPQEVLQPSEPEPTLHPEVQEAGVEAVSDVPDLTLEDQKAGLAPAKESVPVPTAPTGAVTLPTQQQAEAVLKKNKVTDSIAWMATLVLRVLKQKEQTHG